MSLQAASAGTQAAAAAPDTDTRDNLPMKPKENRKALELSPKIEFRDNAQNEQSRRKFSLIRHSGAVLVGALLMTWPALYNRYPLLYPDSMSYLEDGRLVARALFLRKFSADYGGRSFIYCLGILPFHLNVTPWPIVALQALLTAYVIWLVVRSILPRQTAIHYLVLVVLLSLLTSLSWFVSLIMPDILGPVLYLCIYLLVFARETITRTERLTVVLIAWWAVASHATHLMLAVGICVLLALLLVLRRQSMQRRLRAIGEVATIVLLAAAAHLMLHAYLYGEPSLNGERPPFLMARVIADGPGRWYLEQHCEEVKLAICDHVHHLPDDPDDFLWVAGSIWRSADHATQKRLRQEEIPFVLATLRAYPRQQLSKSAGNFWQQLTTFGLEDLGPSDWVLEVFDRILPGGRPRYLQSRDARNALPFEFFTSVQYWTIITSLVVIGAFTPCLWSRRPPRLLGLSAVIVSMVIANGLVTGVLSAVEDRYQSRVIWLLPLLAGVFVLEWLDHHPFTIFSSVVSGTRAKL